MPTFADSRTHLSNLTLLVAPAVPRLWEQFTANGPTGDATKATPELGRELTDRSVEGLVALIERVLSPESRGLWRARFEP